MMTMTLIEKKIMKELVDLLKEWNSYEAKTDRHWK